MAVRDHPLVQINAVHITNGDNALVFVCILFLACNRLSADPVCQGCGSFLSAKIILSVFMTGLATFRRVDPIKTETLTMQIDGVPVDDASYVKDSPTIGP